MFKIAVGKPVLEDKWRINLERKDNTKSLSEGNNVNIESNIKRTIFVWFLNCKLLFQPLNHTA